MNDYAETPSPQPCDHNAYMDAAAWAWLAGPQERAARTAPVIAIVRTLLEIMTDQFQTDEQVHTSVRRAVRLLNAYTATEKPRPGNR